jgi:tetratricopeptide (TPR) repeat protein
MKRFALITIVFGFITTNLFAQFSKVESVKMELEDPNIAEKDLRECKANIDAAKENPKTANDPKMWYYRGLTYYSIYASADAALKSENPTSIDIATESFFESKKTDAKAKYTENADFYLLYCAMGLYNNAINSFNAKEYKKAVEIYKKILQITPLDQKGDLKRNSGGEVTEEKITQLMYYAAQAEGNYTDAKTYINKLISLNFRDPRIYADMATILLMEKDTAAALSYVEKGRAIKEDDKNLINMELDIYLKQGKLQLLLDKLNVAIEGDPENKIYYFARAVSYEGLGNTEKAEADYKKATEVDPDYYDAFYNVGVMYVNKCNPLIEQYQKTYKQSDIDTLEATMDKYYKIAIVNFEKAFENPMMSTAEKVDLAGTMKRIYKKIANTAKEGEMKAFIESNKGK